MDYKSILRVWLHSRMTQKENYFTINTIDITYQIVMFIKIVDVGITFKNCK